MSDKPRDNLEEEPPRLGALGTKGRCGTGPGMFEERQGGEQVSREGVTGVTSRMELGSCRDLWAMC